MGQIDITEQVSEVIEGLSYAEYMQLDRLSTQSQVTIEEYVYIRLMRSINDKSECGAKDHNTILTLV